VSDRRFFSSHWYISNVPFGAFFDPKDFPVTFGKLYKDLTQQQIDDIDVFA